MRALTAQSEISAGVTVSRWARYHRHLEHGDFSLEANTESVPEAGHFYLLRNGRVLLQNDDLRSVEGPYQELCRQHWEGHLASASPSRRLACAWGLLGLEPAHRAAAAVVERDGQPGDHQRLARVRSRLHSQLKRRAYLSRQSSP